MRHHTDQNRIRSTLGPRGHTHNSYRRHICAKVEVQLTLGGENDKLKSKCILQQTSIMASPPDRKVLEYGPKENNLYTYIAFPIGPKTKTADYISEPSGPTLWHHRLAHTSYHTIDNMRKLQTAENFSPGGVHHGLNP